MIVILTAQGAENEFSRRFTWGKLFPMVQFWHFNKERKVIPSHVNFSKPDELERYQNRFQTCEHFMQH